MSLKQVKEIRGRLMRLQVIVEVGAYLARMAQRAEGNWLSATNLAGFTAGLVVMYATAFLVNV